MKKILGLDLGTNSIGWALVNEATEENEKSSIVKLGVRVNPLTVDEQQNFEKGKAITTNADRTLKRSMRRNLQRYKLRRENLIEILKTHGFITDETILSENGNHTTFETYRLRAKAATDEISLEEFARVLLMINKKRGYKSSRKAKGTEDGTLIDGMEVAKKLYEENLTPGQYCLDLLQAGKKYLPDFYRSDLQAEFDKVWNFQKQFYPFLTDELKEELRGKNEKATWAICASSKNVEKKNETFVWKWTETERILTENGYSYDHVEKEKTLVGRKREGNAAEQKIENFDWRAKALSEKIHPEELIVVLQKINGQINGSSGYLGAISDRSKELYFNKQTVGQYQMAVLADNPNASLRNMVFYRQDYLDEFNTLWETQKQFHPELTDELKIEIRDVIIFYQRRLKSQKGLISFCEFENKITEYKKDSFIIKKCPLINYKGRNIVVLNKEGNRIKIKEEQRRAFFEDLTENYEITAKEFKRKIGIDTDDKLYYKEGQRVIPRSSPLFQEFKIWQRLNDIEVSVNGKKSKRKKVKDNSANLFSGIEEIDQLVITGRRWLNDDEKKLIANELSIKWKLTKAEILKLLFKNPQELDLNFPSVQGNITQAKLFEAYKTVIELSGHTLDLKKPAETILKDVKTIFEGLEFASDFLTFNSDAKNLDNEPMYKLWHLLYSFEGDNSNTGNENLVDKLMLDYGFDKDSAKILADITFLDDYGSLSAKAIRKILPYLKEGNTYDLACVYAGYEKHSKSSLTKEEIDNKVLKDKLDILPKNSLRNPVVEKILNQMVNVINTIIGTYGKPDEIRVELARELKKNAKEREEFTKSIADNTKAHEEYKKILSRAPFNLSHISRTDIVRYKLWQELRANGHKTLYSNTYISPSEVFSGTFDIEHIIPQARLFDDSFSNKTLELRDVNLKKGNKTAYDFVKEEYGEEGLQNYLNRVERLYNLKSRIDDDEDTKNAGIISKSKYNKLKMTEPDIPDGFIERDLRNTQYIAKKALAMLNEISRRVVATSGSITDELREDWGLIDIMKELNWDKYAALGLTEIIENKRIDDQGREVINRIYRIKDWTKRNDHRHHAMDALTVAFTKDVFIQYFNNKNASFKANSNEYAIKTKYFDSGKAFPPMPLNEFRAEAKKHLENTLISIKAKNKVVTTNINTTKKSSGTNKKAQQTPRGQLHLETIYGSQKKYVTKEEKIETTFTEAKILTVTNPKYREALLKRLQENDNDPKKAFGGKNAPAKNPIYCVDTKSVKITLPEKVKTVTFETIYTIRKDISPDLNLDKIVDRGVKTVLENRLKEYDGDAKKAFSNLHENPIWLNKERGISIKRVTITGVANGEPLHEAKDKDGKPILDREGKKIPVDFVNTGNNHHVAVYRKPKMKKVGADLRVCLDDNGNPIYELEENVVSFYEAVARVNMGLPIVDKEYRKSEDYEFLFTMKQNEYFIFPRTEKREKVNEETDELTEEEVVTFDPKDCSEDWFKNPDNYAVISPNLFRVQKISHKNYVFRHHLETSIVNTSTSLRGIIWTDFRSSKGLDNIIKVRVNHIGQIVGVGEY